MSINKRAFSLVELLVVVAIISAMLGMMLPAIQKVRESSNSLTCENNFRQVGLAIHAFHTNHAAFPKTAYFGGFQLHEMLLPYVEEQNKADAIANGDFVDLTVRIYYCPTRRGPDFSGAHTDQGYAQNGSMAAPEHLSILDNEAGIDPEDPAGNTTLLLVNKGDGSSNTMLMSHKSFLEYDLGEEWGVWTDGCGGARVFRDASRPPLRDNLSTPDGYIFGSQHTGNMPSLMADGGIRRVSYSVSTTVWQNVWSFNDGQLSGI